MMDLMTMQFGGLKLLSSDAMTVPAEDWSQVRSPGRARRRLKRGHPQRIRHYPAADPKVIITRDAIIGHPVTIARLARDLPTIGQRRVI
jgi:hypothetical protein